MLDLFSICCNFSQCEPPSTKTAATQGTEEDFQLPLHYLDADKRHAIHATVSSDLELLSREKGGDSIYETICKPRHVMGTHTLGLWNREFTSDIAFLKEMQSIIRAYNFSDPDPDNIHRVRENWKELKNDDFFLEKYGFMEWSMLKFVNYSEMFLEIMSIAQILSPLLTLFLPFFILIIPFFILKFKGIQISLDSYIETLKIIAQNHFFGKILDAATSAASLQNTGYLFLTTGMYLYSLYSNVILCQHFYKNVEKMNKNLIELRTYLKNTIDNMNRFYSAHVDKPGHRPFCEKVRVHAERLRIFSQKLEGVTPFCMSMGKLTSIGSMLKIYYEMHDSEALDESIQYSLCFQGYLDNLRGVNARLSSGDVAFAEFVERGVQGSEDEEGQTDKEGEGESKGKGESEASQQGKGEGKKQNQNRKQKRNSTVFRGQVYPLILPDSKKPQADAVKNDLSMEKNIILTGPNASGKTTVLKTTLINIIFSQQWGCGFYSSARFHPYTHIHSYLNIPDSSGRDSLFQAESRRCKDILDCVHATSPGETHHFCIFDELYSGTNYKEATKAALSFLQYLTRFPHVDFILTTHYRKICKKKTLGIENYKMHVIEDGENIKYTFRMKRGVSKVEGGVRILREMNYPDEMIRAMTSEQGAPGAPGAPGEQSKRVLIK